MNDFAIALTESLLDRAEREAGVIERGILNSVREKLRRKPELMTGAIAEALEVCNLELKKKESDR